MILDSARQLAPALFSECYSEARERILAATPTARAYPCSAKGPSGEALFTDVSYIGPPDAERLLVLISGTHGVEGYCGSAGQLIFLLAEMHKNLPRSTAVLMIHALNCYGFAWDRRVTAEGCDLNRNFVDFSKPLPRNAGYEALAEHIVPADISEPGIQRAEAALAAFSAAHGERTLIEAYSTGQYSAPGGMFYGGIGPTEARRTLERVAEDFNLASRERVVIVDYHTGLGAYGYGELQCEQASGLEGYERARKIFGSSVTSTDLGTSSSIPISGTLDEFWQRILGDRHTYVALEFGTYPRPGGRVALRSDHWLFMYGPQEVDSELGRQIRRATKRHYYPQAADWQEMVVWRSHQVHRLAMSSLGQ